MFDMAAKEIMMKELSQIAQEVKQSKQALHSQFCSEIKAVDGKFLGKGIDDTRSPFNNAFDISNKGNMDGIGCERALDGEGVKKFFSEESSYLRSMEERRDFALGSDGQWYADGDKIKFKPDDQAATSKLEEKGLDGIQYDKYAEPDFSKVALESVEIEGFSSDRLLNYEKAFEKYAEKWSESGFEGKNDWTARDVNNWRKANNYSPHERSDMKTIELVPKEIHEACKHYGGVAEAKAKEGLVGGAKYDN